MYIYPPLLDLFFAVLTNGCLDYLLIFLIVVYCHYDIMNFDEMICIPENNFPEMRADATERFIGIFFLNFQNQCRKEISSSYCHTYLLQ